MTTPIQQACIYGTASRKLARVFPLILIDSNPCYTRDIPTAPVVPLIIYFNFQADLRPCIQRITLNPKP